MPKQYYAYIPFKPDAHAEQIGRGIERWRSNVETIHRQNELDKALVTTLTANIARGGMERMALAETVRMLAEAQARIIPGPVLRKAPEILRHDNGASQPLTVLRGKDQNEYVLYISGHCAPGSTELRNTQSARTATDPLSGQQLLDRMVADGLPKQILNVKLLACWGGSPHPTDNTQKAFAESFWRALRGYCDALVKLKAYTEPVQLTQFYGADLRHKTHSDLRLGQVVDTANVPVGGRLGNVARRFTSEPCFVCQRPVLKRCTVCKLLFCSQPCVDKHLDEGGNCRLKRTAGAADIAPGERRTPSAPQQPPGTRQ